MTNGIAQAITTPAAIHAILVFRNNTCTIKFNKAIGD